MSSAPTPTGQHADFDLSTSLNPQDLMAEVNGEASMINNDAATADGLAFEDFSDFSKLLPTFVKPAKACDYCSARKLDCHLYFGHVTCTSCDALFRTCSFVGDDRQLLHSADLGVLDTLHIVQEDECTSAGALTGIKQLRSQPSAPTASRSDAPKKTAPRFSKPAIRALRAWFDAHIDYPYPTETEKVELEQLTGLKATQITTWLANTRRRSKNTVAKNPFRDPSPSRRPAAATTKPIDMPAGAAAMRDWTDLNPMERWRHSPPENEPAPFNAIADAVATSEFLNEAASSPESLQRPTSNSGPSFSVRRANSVTTLETSQESITTRKSENSSAAWSQGSQSSFGSFNSFGSGLLGKRDRQRKRRSRAPLHRSGLNDEKRMYQCTFCCDTFKTKYDWTRHEKTLHLSLEKWTCTPCGAVETDPDTGSPVCAYCRAPNPSESHIESHSHSECVTKGPEARTFYRKDHLRQHLRLVHHCPLVPAMEKWKSSADALRSRCGFCAMRFMSWSERNDHLATHFRQGARMKDWKRCRGLDPEIAAHVTNAMPPYLIGNESTSTNPFSATSGVDTSKNWAFAYQAGDTEGHTVRDTNRASALRNPSKPSCWEIMTVRLANFVEKTAASGVKVTDEMMQKEARIRLYGENDPFDHTPPDDEVWLDMFKKAYCHDIIPAEVGGVGRCVPEDLELYIDLGMRIPFAVLQARLQGEFSTTQLPGYGFPNSASCRSPDVTESGPPRLPGPKPSDFNRTMYEDLPLHASRLAHFETVPQRNPVIYEQYATPISNLPQRSGSSSGVSFGPRSDSLFCHEQASTMDESQPLPLDVENMLAEMSSAFNSQDISPSHDNGAYDPMEFINFDMMDCPMASTAGVAYEQSAAKAGMMTSVSPTPSLALFERNPELLVDEEFDFGEMQF